MASVADAEGDVPEAEGAATAKPKRSKKLLAIVGAVVVLAALGGGYFYMGHAKHAAATAAAAPKPPTFIDIPDMIVNLSGPSDRPQYLRLKIALEVADPRLVEQVQPMMPRVLDAFQTHLREMRASDLQGSAGLFRLKEELLKRINEAVYPAKIDAVLFKEMLVQ